MIVAGIPAYNEEKTIAKVILLAQKHVDVVIVCDDGSVDMTAEIAQRLGALVIKHSKNLGYGTAVQSLFEKARSLNADVLITLDADGQHDAEEIQRLLNPIIEGKADVVVGSRFLQESRDLPVYRRFGIKLLTKVTNGRADENKLSDAQCGFRAYNRRTIEALHLIESGMGVSAEIVMKARNQGLTITEVPVQTHYKGLETSTHNPLRHGISVLSTILRLVVEERPLFYLGLPGLLLLVTGIAFGLWTLQLYALEQRIVTNVFLSSIAFTLTGIFAIFTAITLFAIVRLDQKRRAEQR